MTKIGNFYDDSISWAFLSATKKKKILQSDVPKAPPESTLSFPKGLVLLYCNGSGSRELVTFDGIDFVDDMQLKCKVKKKDGSIMTVDPESLNFIENPDVASIPQISAAYCRDCENISAEELEQVLNPTSLSPLQEEMMSHHNRLHHLPFPKLILLAEKNEIPKRLAELKGQEPICVACIFGKAHKQPWRSKSKDKKHIRNMTDDEPGKRVSLDQIVSAQPGLIPQMSGFLTNLRIMGATVFVDHFSDHVFVYLMKNHTLEETLLAKEAYE